jgi:SH3 domain-containing YSC84-like protein 1
MTPTTQNWNRRGIAGPLVTTFTMATIGLGALAMARPIAATPQQPVVSAEAREEVQDATAAFKRVVAARPIPQAILDKAVGVAAFDNLVKAAFIVGGTGGDGVIVRKTPNGWGAPAFVNLAGASVGAQIGGSRTDAVLLFMNQAALDSLANGKIEFGTSIQAVAGPVTADAESLSKSTAAHILVYAKQEGLFAGASANGVTLTLDGEENRAVYGAATPDLLTGMVKAPAGLEGFALAIKGKTAGS